MVVSVKESPHVWGESAERIVYVVSDNTLSESSLDVRPNNIAGAESRSTAQVG